MVSLYKAGKLVWFLCQAYDLLNEVKEMANMFRKGFVFPHPSLSLIMGVTTHNPSYAY